MVDSAQVLEIMRFLFKQEYSKRYSKRDGSSAVADVTTKESMEFHRPRIEIIFLVEWSYFAYINNFYSHLEVESAPFISFEKQT